MVSSSVSARFLYGFPYRFQRAWTVLCSMKHPLDVVRVRAWNSLCVCVCRAASLSHCMILQWCNHGEQQFMTLVPQNLASSGIINSLEANWISNYGIKKYNFHPISDYLMDFNTRYVTKATTLGAVFTHAPLCICDFNMIYKHWCLTPC